MGSSRLPGVLLLLVGRLACPRCRSSCCSISMLLQNVCCMLHSPLVVSSSYSFC